MAKAKQAAKVRNQKSGAGVDGEYGAAPGQAEAAPKENGMTHHGCGGTLFKDTDISYAVDGKWQNALRCGKCRKEILGNLEIDLPPDHEGQAKEG